MPQSFSFLIEIARLIDQMLSSEPSKTRFSNAHLVMQRTAANALLAFFSEQLETVEISNDFARDRKVALKERLATEPLFSVLPLLIVSEFNAMLSNLTIEQQKLVLAVFDFYAIGLPPITDSGWLDFRRSLENNPQLAD